MGWKLDDMGILAYFLSCGNDVEATWENLTTYEKHLPKS